MGDIFRNVFRLAFRVDDKQEAVEGFQQKRPQQLRVQQGRFRRRDVALLEQRTAISAGRCRVVAVPRTGAGTVRT